MNPLITIIIPTFNRAATISRTIDSILNQTYQNFEIVVVDDGSVDETSEILAKYDDNRIRIILHDLNKGVTAAKNTGLNNIEGDWFTILDSDDEIVSQALEVMINVALQLDNEVTAVTCNCIDSSTGKFSGSGLDFDQYVDFRTIVTNCHGEFWGITKTELLQNDRFNERLSGFESVLWYKIYERSKRYYVHQALRIYHTTGTDRISVNVSPKKKSNDYQALSEETQYLKLLKEYKPDSFAKGCLEAVIYLKADNKKKFARFYFQYLKKLENYRLHKIISFFTYYSNPIMVNLGIKFWKTIK